MMNETTPYTPQTAPTASPTVDEIRARRLGEISERALLWLALPPAWTIPLAQACGFPGGRKGVAELFDDAVGRGLLQTDATPPAATPYDLASYDPSFLADLGLSASPAPATYWITPVARADILRHALENPEPAGPLPLAEAGTIGERLLKVRDAGSTPEQTGRWAELAARLRHDGGRTAARFLDQRLDGLLDPNRDASNDALHWIEAATPLAELAGGEFLAAVQRSNRRLELYHRRTFDRRHLPHFLRRDEQFRAFERLLTSPPGEWALHYVGLGGVGKSMLLRYLTLAVTEGEVYRGCCARIDFDHLNPSYPARAPGLLLDQLAAELRLYDRSGRAARAFKFFDELLNAFHERLGEPLRGPLPPVPADDPQFLNVIQAFVQAATLLPQPVLLILDTCEELARVGSEGQVPPNVQATFAILERLQQWAKPGETTLRVIFGGRRPLASAGPGWTWPAAAPLPARPYLRLHELRGFTLDEARTFLVSKAGVPPEPDDRIRAIVERSPDLGAVGGLQWSDPAAEPADVPRCNPFALNLYADWVHEVPALDAGTIRHTDADQYIEMRLLGRLPATLRRVLPLVSLLGRFDLPMLQAALAEEGEAGGLQSGVADLFTDLARQEWVEWQQTFLEVNRELLPRLRAYYARHGDPLQDRALPRVVAYLEQLTLHEPRAALSFTAVENAYRLLQEQDPTAAADWWSRFEARCVREREWASTETLCDRLLATDDAALHPLVLATRCSMRLHRADYGRLCDDWQQVLANAAGVPHPTLAARLRVRGLAGSLAAAPDASLTPDVTAWLEALLAPEGLTSARPLADDPALATALLAALEGVLDLHSRTPAAVGPDLLLDFSRNLQTGLSGLPDRLIAWGSALTARAYVQTGNPGKALEALQAALALARSPRIAPLPVTANALSESVPAGTPGPTPAQASIDQQPWPDWLPPDDLVARIRLELVTLAYPALRSPVDTQETAGVDLPAPGTIDADRLGSALLAVEATTSPPSSERYASLSLPPAAGSSRPAASHMAVPPLFATLALARGREGEVDRGLEALDQAISESESAAYLPAQEAAKRARLQLIREFRLRDEGRGSGTLDFMLRQDPADADRELLAAVESLSAAWRLSSAAATHAWWRSRPAFAEADARALAALDLPTGSPVPDADFTAASCFLDAVERNLLLTAWPAAAPDRSVSGQLDAAAWTRNHPGEPLQALILHLRAAALAPDYFRSAQGIDVLLERTGRLRAARVALDEGELLALRLPARGAVLLVQAATWAAACGDAVLALQASTAAALAYARTGARISLQEQVQTIETHLSRLQRTGLRLPDWSQITLDNLRAAPGPDGTRWPPGYAGWRPWLARIVAARAALADLTQGTSELPAVLDWVNETYSVRGNDDTRAVPSEFEGLRALTFAAGTILAVPESGPANSPDGDLDLPRPSDRDLSLEPERARSATDNSRAGGCLTSLGLRKGSVIAAVVVALVCVGLLVMLFALGGNVIGPVRTPVPPTPSTTSTPPPPPPGFLERTNATVLLAGILLLLALAAAGVWQGYRLLRRRRPAVRPSRPEVMARLSYPPIRLAIRPASPTGRVPFDAIPSLSLGYDPASRDASTFEVEETTFESYAAGAARVLGPGLAAELALDGNDLLAGTQSLTLQTDPSLTAIGWEGLVGTVLAADLAKPEPGHLRAARSIAGARAMRWETEAGPGRMVAAYSGLQLPQFLHQVWESLTIAGGSFAVLDIAQGDARPDTETQIVHIMVPVVRVTGGVRLAAEAYDSYSMVQQSKIGTGQGQLLDAEEIRRRFPALHLVILQPPPAPLDSPRSRQEYEQAANLRELAGDLFMLGVPAVLTLPALPQKTTHAALQPVAHMLVDWGNAGGFRSEADLRARLLPAVSELRRVIATAEDPAAWEAAWEVCLYVG